jgi:hypothetical protein
MEMPSGPAALLDRLQKVMGIPAPTAQAPRPVAEEEKPKEPSEALRQDAVARLSERLLLMEECTSANGRKSLLAVVDQDSQAVAPTLSLLLKQSFGAKGDEVALEVLDRATYETLQRLINAGILAVTTKATRRLHCGAGFEEKTSMTRKEEDRRRQEAMQFVQRGDRKWKMATVLVSGGFADEAIAPMKEAVGLGLKALACLAGEKVGDEELSPAAVESALVPAGLLPAEHAGWIAELRGIATAEAVPEARAKVILGHADQVLQGISETIQRRALG